MEYSQNRRIIVYDDKHIVLYELENYRLFIQQNRLVFLKGLERDTNRQIELKFLIDTYMLEEFEDS